MTKMTVSNYLLKRVSELGIKDIFGVPGDYNLIFLDQIIKHKSLRWIGNCNELNAAYAADGYARVNGFGALVTTFGVGELSAINGIAGSYAEFLPIVHIVGAPSIKTQKEGSIVHHTFGTGDFSLFIKMFEKTSAAVAILHTPETAAEQIDRTLEICFVKKQPVYISLPSNMVDIEIEVTEKPLKLAYPNSDPNTVAECVSDAATYIRQAKSPVILADMCAIRHPMKTMIQKLLDQTGIPFATMNLGKGLINESHPSFIGFYNGNYSTPCVQKRVEESDCILSFGSLYSDFNTGGFTAKINAKAAIEIHSNHVKIHHALYLETYFNAVIPALIESLRSYRHEEKKINPKKFDYKPSKIKTKPTQKHFWEIMAQYFRAEDIIIAESGTAMFGLLESSIPDDVTFIAQCLWGSIGYTMGAALGAAIANPSRRTLLFIGDGSFQLTAQELSTVLRHKLNPIIFLINNDGYTVERLIHGKNMPYNDIQPWKYTELPAVFGSNAFTAKVNFEDELSDVLVEVEQNRDKMCFIEIIMDKDDCPESLRHMCETFEARNKA